MNDFGKTKIFLGLQIKHISKGIFPINQIILKRNWKALTWINLILWVLSWFVDPLMWIKIHFVMPKDNEEIIGPYLSAIRALMYLDNWTIPYCILLARFSFSLTRKHWNGVKQTVHNLCGTTDLGLFNAQGSKLKLIGYADVGYMCSPHMNKARSHI